MVVEDGTLPCRGSLFDPLDESIGDGVCAHVECALCVFLAQMDDSPGTLKTAAERERERLAKQVCLFAPRSLYLLP